MVKTLLSKAGGAGSIPGQGTKIPHDSQPKNRSSIVTNSIKTWKKKVVHIFKKRIFKIKQKQTKNHHGIKPDHVQGNPGIFRFLLHTNDSHGSKVVWWPRYQPRTLTVLGPGTSSEPQTAVAKNYLTEICTFAKRSAWHEGFFKVYLRSFWIYLQFLLSSYNI